MRKLYLLVALAALIPVTYAAGCGNNETSSGGGNTSQGGQIQDFAYSVKVTWTLYGSKPTATSCGDGGQVLVRLSGTEDPSLHGEKTVDCTKGEVDFSGFSRLSAGTTLYIEGYLQNSMEMTLLSTMTTVTPTMGGEVDVKLEFVMPTSSATTTTTTEGPGPTGGGMGGMGGSGGMGGAGGAGQSSSQAASSSSKASSAANSSSSSG